MILGYEACRSCDWKHVFWEDDGEPEPQLIAGLGMFEPFVCPACRKPTGHRMQLCPIPASALLEPWEIEARYPKTDQAKVAIVPDVETATVLAPMTLRQHLRALARWWTPWAEETRLWLICVGCIYFVLGSIGLATSGYTVLGALIVMPLWLIKFFLWWRMIITILSVGFGSLTQTSRTALAGIWREFGQKPVFPHYQFRKAVRADAKQSAAWLRQQGFDRRAAMKIARNNAWARQSRQK